LEVGQHQVVEEDIEVDCDSSAGAQVPPVSKLLPVCFAIHFGLAAGHEVSETLLSSMALYAQLCCLDAGWSQIHRASCPLLQTRHLASFLLKCIELLDIGFGWSSQAVVLALAIHWPSIMPEVQRAPFGCAALL